MTKDDIKKSVIDEAMDCISCLLRDGVGPETKVYKITEVELDDVFEAGYQAAIIDAKRNTEHEDRHAPSTFDAYINHCRWLDQHLAEPGGQE